MSTKELRIIGTNLINDFNKDVNAAFKDGFDIVLDSGIMVNTSYDYTVVMIKVVNQPKTTSFNKDTK